MIILLGELKVMKCNDASVPPLPKDLPRRHPHLSMHLESSHLDRKTTVSGVIGETLLIYIYLEANLKGLRLIRLHWKWKALVRCV